MNIQASSSHLLYSSTNQYFGPREQQSIKRPSGQDDIASIESARPVEGVVKSDGLAADGDKGVSSYSTASDAQGEGADENRERRVKERLEQAELKQDQEQIKQLSARDREVRAHEQAHAAVGGQYAGAPQYQFQRGPDGVSYAVGGEVPIDISKAATPQETIQKMQVVRRAALAPAEPSPQDRKVAAEAASIEAQARRDVVIENRDAMDVSPSEVEEKDGAIQEGEKEQNVTQRDSAQSSTGDAPESNTISSKASRAIDQFVQVLSTRSEVYSVSQGLDQLA